MARRAAQPDGGRVDRRLHLREFRRHGLPHLAALNRTFSMSLTMASFSATACLQIGSVLGVLTGGMIAAAWVRRDRRGRILTQAVGLFAGVPLLLVTGWTFSVTVFVFAAIGYGFGHVRCEYL